MPLHEARAQVTLLKTRLEVFGLASSLAVCDWSGARLPAIDGCLDVDAAVEADLLLDLRYDISPQVIARFRRTALIDIDPGILQFWIGQGKIALAPHDAYFTIGETAVQSGGSFSTFDHRWLHTAPPVFLPEWQVSPSKPTASFTTISSWWGEWMELDGQLFSNEKRTAFLEYLKLPSQTSAPLELALCLEEQPEVERPFLERHGWRVRRAWDVTATPEKYHRYIQQSRGEFSCAKPAYVRFANAWMSDRTVCYLASGKPAVVQRTGSSRFLPDRSGLFRFRTPDEAAACLKAVEADYATHCRMARALAEEFFDARKIVGHVLERALA